MMRSRFRTLTPVFALFLTIACSHGRAIVRDDPARSSVDLLTESSDSLGWNGIRLGMTRSSLEQLLHRPLHVRPDDVAVCGSFYSIERLAGRDVYVQWSSDGEDGRVELIHVPLIGSERTTSAEQLAFRAASRISSLVDAPESPPFPGASRSAHLVLRDRPEMSLLLKPRAPDEALYVSYTECLD